MVRVIGPNLFEEETRSTTIRPGDKFRDDLSVNLRALPGMKARLCIVVSVSDPDENGWRIIRWKYARQSKTQKEIQKVRRLVHQDPSKRK